MVQRWRRPARFSEPEAPGPIPPLALDETGHFYFAQTGHSHFAATFFLVVGQFDKLTHYLLFPKVDMQ
jgi:hypothetical protein